MAEVWRPPSEEEKGRRVLASVAEMLAGRGRHRGHRRRDDGIWVVCSCRMRAIGADR